MFEDDEQEVSDLDIESKTWNKLQNNMKSIGFCEGAAKGKELSLQEGFNLGYLEGLKVGQCLGMVKGSLSGESQLKLTLNEKISFNEETLSNLSSETCIICLKEKMFKTFTNNEMVFEKFEDLVSTQHSHSNEMMKALKKFDLHDLKPWMKDDTKLITK